MNAFIRYYATRTVSAATISTSPACREIHFRAQKYEKSSYKYCIVSFFSSASPACLIAARCIGHRTALHHPSHRTASATAPHSSKCSTSPHRLPHPAVHPLSSPRRTLPSALITFSPAPLHILTCAPPHSPQRPSTHAPWYFLRFRSLLCPHFPSRAQYIYNVPETKLHIFEKKRSQRFVNMPNRPTFAIAKRKQGLPSEAEHSRKHIGRLAQLVQSVCLTSRGSAVRIRQRPQEIRWNGSLAQLNRAFDYGSKGYRFESYRSHTRVQASRCWVDTRVAKWGRL